MSYGPIVHMQSGNDPLPITVCSTHTHILGGPFTIQIEAIGIVVTLWPICGTYFLLLVIRLQYTHKSQFGYLLMSHDSCKIAST